MLDARIDHVTLYASGARVRRVTTLTGIGVVRVTGLPIGVIDDTVRVVLASTTVVARSIRVVVEAPEAAPEIAEDPADLVAARRRTAIAELEVARISHALDVAAAAPLVEADPTDEPPAAWADIVAARRAVLVARGQRNLAMRDQLAGALREREIAGEAQRLLEVREALASNARTAKPHELRKTVEIELAGSGAGAIEATIEYHVAAARWAPSYVARLDGDAVRFEMRAVVAQSTGEDWSNVALALSTAEPARFSVLPELLAQRIGRRQDAPARAGFRSPPTGARALYADFERAFPAPIAHAIATKKVPVTTTILAEPSPDIAGEVWDESSSRAKEAFHTPPAGTAVPELGRGRAGTAVGGAPSANRAPMAKMKAMAMPPQQSAAPMGMPMRRMSEQAKKRDESDGRMADMLDDADEDTNMPSDRPAMPEELGIGPPRLDYGNLRMAGIRSPARGSLIPAEGDPWASTIANEVSTRARRVFELPLPAGCTSGWDHTYDYAYVADGRVDVKSDGAWTSLAIATTTTTAKLRHVTVPREQPDAFRMAGIANPLAGPLLPGPIDVYDRGQFLVTSTVDFTPPGGNVEIGLGVDPLVKIARNTEFREEAAGMLRGALRLLHGITVEVENLGKRPIDLEVRERVPVSREGDDDVEIMSVKAEPAWDAWSPPPESPHEPRLRGGHRWRTTIAPATKKSLRASYEVKIASKHEVIGGNRREK